MKKIDFNMLSKEELEDILNNIPKIKNRLNNLRKNDENKMIKSLNIGDCFYESDNNTIIKITNISLHEDGYIIYYDFVEISERQMVSGCDAHDFFEDLDFKHMEKIPSDVFDNVFSMCDEFNMMWDEMHANLYKKSCETLKKYIKNVEK